MNIDAYKTHIHSGLQRLEDLITKINDIVENRIQKNLKQISRAVLVILPNERSVALDEFVLMQENAVKTTTHLLTMKNLEVEVAVGDLIDMLGATAVDPVVDAVTEEDKDEVTNYFNSITYQALLNCIRNSLNLVKKRACSRPGLASLMKQEPFFEVWLSSSSPPPSPPRPLSLSLSLSLSSSEIHESLLSKSPYPTFSF